MRQPRDATEPTGEFEGYFCPSGLTDDYFKELEWSEIVHVKGSGPKKQVDETWKNPFGHTLLCLGPKIGYVHSCEPGQHPCRYIPEEDWKRYCREMGKPEEPERRIRLGDKITTPEAVKSYVNQVLQYGYDWKTKHDCSSMVDEALAAGGVEKKHLSNTVMPAVAVVKEKAKDKIRGYEKM
jgi:hypothetical protein